MSIELLYREGCPNYDPARRALQKALSQEGMEAEIEAVVVSSEDEARRLGFPGSPAIRRDGGDILPVEDREEWGLRCRVYSTPEGPKGHPTAEMTRRALGGGKEPRGGSS